MVTALIKTNNENKNRILSKQRLQAIYRLIYFLQRLQREVVGIDGIGHVRLSFFEQSFCFVYDLLACGSIEVLVFRLGELVVGLSQKVASEGNVGPGKRSD